MYVKLEPGEKAVDLEKTALVTLIIALLLSMLLRNDRCNLSDDVLFLECVGYHKNCC